MIFLWQIIITIICGSLVLLVFHIRKRKSHPPGPLGFPLMGSLPLKIIQLILAKSFPKIYDSNYWKRAREKYGDFWSFEIGSQRVVILASIEIVTEAHINNAPLFNGRPINNIFKVLFGEGGVIFSNGETWKENRQMSIRALREFGMDKRELESQICDEIDELTKYIKSNKSKPIKTSHCFIKAVSNVISRLMFKEGNDYDDPEFDNYITNLKSMFQSKVFLEECMIFPKFSTTKLGRFLFSSLDDYFNSWDIAKGFIKNKCKRKLQSETEAESPECVFEYFWKFRYQHDQSITDDQKMEEIFITIFDLYNGASETTNGFLIFSFLMLGKYEDVQNEIRKELKLLTDDYSQITTDMKKKCPTLLSFIDEVHRYCCVLPRYFRNVVEPCTFNGYKLYPEDLMYVDFGTISRDPKLFPNPDVFNPYRFTDESRSRYVPDKNLIPFGIGKRVCLGENMANMEIFLFLSKIIFNFHISFPAETKNNFEKISLGLYGFTHGALEHELNFDLLNST